jgi:hypothetical protein
MSWDRHGMDSALWARAYPELVVVWVGPRAAYCP